MLLRGEYYWFRSLQKTATTMADYSHNEIINILFILGRCMGKYLRAENWYKFPHRPKPNYNPNPRTEGKGRSDNLKPPMR